MPSTSSVDTAVNARVTECIQQQVAAGTQVGVQVCVYQGEDVVVDTQAGAMGPDDNRAVQPDSLFLSFSATKGVAATAIHMLADRGQLDYDAPVAKYWPAFAANGKGEITVAQAVSHQGGLHAMPLDFKPEHITDWEAGIKRMEEGVPAYPPGTSTGYHAVTFGWITGGIVHGVTGRHIKDFIVEEIAAPLGVGDEFYVGIPSGIEDRLTTLEVHGAGEGLGLAPESDFHRAMPWDMWPHFNGMPFREACLPSGNGHFSARALARMYAAHANGGAIDGARLVSAQRIPAMQELQTDATDIVLGVPVRKSVGFMMGGATDGIHGPMGERESAFGHPGAGGSIGFADPEAGLAVAITINKMAYPLPGEGTTLEITDLIRSELGG
jgi:CubicO group peptidase (beta-lactamase class C family)